MIGEGQFEYDEEVTEFVGRFVVGHAVTLDCLDFIRLGHFPRLGLYSDLAAVEVGKHEVDAGQGLKQSRFPLNKKVGALAFEEVVWLLIHLNDNIACLYAGVLISLGVEDILLTIWRALVDGDIKDLLLLDDLPVFFIDNLARTMTRITRPGALGVHSRAQLLHVGPHTFALAVRTRGDSTSLVAFALALGVDTIATHHHFSGLAIV